MKRLQLGLGWISLNVALVSVGCAGDETDGMSDSGSTSADTGSEATSSASQTSTSGPGTSTTSAMTSSSTTADTGGSSSGEDTADTTTGADSCAGVPRNECAEDPSCEPIACSPFVMMDIGVTPWCIGETEYLGCRSADIKCNEMRTTTCEANADTVYVCVDDCIPQGWDKCDPPVDGMVGPCM